MQEDKEKDEQDLVKISSTVTKMFSFRDTYSFNKALQKYVQISVYQFSVSVQISDTTYPKGIDVKPLGLESQKSGSNSRFSNLLAICIVLGKFWVSCLSNSSVKQK